MGSIALLGLAHSYTSWSRQEAACRSEPIAGPRALQLQPLHAREAFRSLQMMR